MHVADHRGVGLRDRFGALSGGLRTATVFPVTFTLTQPFTLVMVGVAGVVAEAGGAATAAVMEAAIAAT